MEDNQNNNKPKHQDKIVALDSLSLGISIVAAIIIGFGVGYGLKQFSKLYFISFENKTPNGTTPRPTIKPNGINI